MGKPGILWVSDSRESICVAEKIYRAGIHVDYYIHDPTYRSNFAGMLPNIGMSDIPAALRRCDNVWFDITLPNHKTNRDLELFHRFGVSSNSPGVFGEIADKLSKTHWVVGSSSWTEKAELNREYGFDIAKKCGFDIPEYQKFKGLKEGIKFLQGPGKDQKWVFKLLNNGPLDLTYPETFPGEILDMMITSLPTRLIKEKVNPEQAVYILQSFVDGVECSNELWFDGDEFSCASRTIEDKKLGSGNTGPATGSQSNVVAMCEDMDGHGFKEIQKLKPYLVRAGYVGPVDANIIFNENKAYFLEWTPRLGWSAFYCLCSFIPDGQLSNFILNDFQAVFKGGYVASQLISLYPYPNLDKKQLEMMVKGNLINHRLQDLNDFWLQDVYLDDSKQLRVAGSDGIVGVLTGHGDTVEESIDKVHDRIKKLQIQGNLQYRTRHDHMTRAIERVNKLNKMEIGF